MLILLLGGFVAFRYFFSPERLNQIGRTVGTTFGFDYGVVEYYSMGRLVARFFNVEKLTTASGTYENQTRPYRFGYGYRDANLNGVLDADEDAAGKAYFEVPVYADYLYYDGKRDPRPR
ncbi:MAG TPA: hypothetical protein ENK37_05680 [Oceanithermus profundus]|uniref:Uncharacterized protein n=1 Tax=Oceanithermus profundus TaxID=187137 RepID=A0A7C4V5S5_9DEIN|nr:hypothetical protein [Oceanithermus profundus]